MLLNQIKNIKRGRRELRNFGLLVGGVLVCVALYLGLRGSGRYGWFAVPGVALVMFGALFPRGLTPVYVPWMTLALALGFVVSHVVLTLFFYLVITPAGLIARLAGRDFLRLKLDRQASTYWLPHEKRERGPDAYERQY